MYGKLFISLIALVSFVVPALHAQTDQPSSSLDSYVEKAAEFSARAPMFTFLTHNPFSRARKSVS